ncbi:MAG TPA: dual specificity protein phosphatase family protein, partial [Chthoniobacterales bacterium]
ESAPLRAVIYHNIPILDLTAPTNEQLEEMVSFVERESETGIVYVHCKIGYSRTAAVAAAYLLRSRLAMSVSDAVEMVRSARSAVVIRPEMLAALREFAANDFSSRPAIRSFNNEPCL